MQIPRKTVVTILASALLLGAASSAQATGFTATETSGPSIANKADILAYDTNGELWNYGTLNTAGEPRVSISPAGAVPKATFLTDWNADGIQDLIVQENVTNPSTQKGTLTLRKGLATGGFEDTVIGIGWHTFKITVGKWKNTDAYPSVIARENSTGTLYVYPNTSGDKMSPRVQIGTGWNNFLEFNLLDWDKDGNNDIVARDTNGYQKLYRTNGAGAFINETRATIGSGWNAFSTASTLSEHNGPGTVGLLAQDTETNTLYYYQANTSQWAPRVALGSNPDFYSVVKH